MAFTPDVIVTAPDSLAVTLVAEAKREGANLDETAQPLKQYMLRMRCPVGIIFTPLTLRIYKDRFVNRSEDSIEMVGDFPGRDLFKATTAGSMEHSMVESALVHWLDELARTGQARVLDPKLKLAIDEYILPAVSGGLVSIAHPGAISR
jgi:hypothetical protein